MDPLVQQRRPDLVRGGIHEPLRVQHLQHPGPLLGDQGRGLAALLVWDGFRPRRRRAFPVDP